MDAAHLEAFEVLVNACIPATRLPTVSKGLTLQQRAELVLGTIARKTKKNGDSEGDYLEDSVTFSEDKLMDSDSKAVMMGWEKPLMEAHAKAVATY
ncbi:hypothetical protein GQ457_03G040030 [Hibiscus cannabinus]